MKFCGNRLPSTGKEERPHVSKSARRGAPRARFSGGTLGLVRDLGHPDKFDLKSENTGTTISAVLLLRTFTNANVSVIYDQDHCHLQSLVALSPFG